MCFEINNEKCLIYIHLINKWIRVTNQSECFTKVQDFNNTPKCYTNTHCAWITTSPHFLESKTLLHPQLKVINSAFFTILPILTSISLFSWIFIKSLSVYNVTHVLLCKTPLPPASLRHFNPIFTTNLYSTYILN